MTSEALRRILMLGASIAVLASCAAHDPNPVPGAHPGVCTTNPDAQKCVDGTVGGAKS